jgi:hypothetical protein
MTRIAIVTVAGVLLARAALAAGQVGSLAPAVSHAQSPACAISRR